MSTHLNAVLSVALAWRERVETRGLEGQRRDEEACAYFAGAVAGLEAAGMPEAAARLRLLTYLLVATSAHDAVLNRIESLEREGTSRTTLTEHRPPHVRSWREYTATQTDADGHSRAVIVRWSGLGQRWQVRHVVVEWHDIPPAALRSFCLGEPVVGGG